MTADRTDPAPRPDGPPRAGELPALTFPDLPRLELDQLLEQLVGRAREVQATQGRLRGLLRANQVVIADLTLPTVLRHIAEAARELVGARYAALGVIAPDGGLAEFVHVGMDDSEVERIGTLPAGKGLLGALIEDPHPIRIGVISDDERSAGFPDGHPPMNTFLGVPVRIRDEVYGNLYLAESPRGVFSAEDEELAQALAATAAVAIDNARSYGAARARQEWLRASAAVTHGLLNPDFEPGLDRALRLITATGRAVADAEMAFVVRPSGDGLQMRVEVADGEGSEGVLGLTMPAAETLSGQVMAAAQPIRMNDPAEHGGFSSAAVSDLGVGPTMLLPLRGSQRAFGILAVTRTRPRSPFTDDDLDMAAGFAAQVALALELAEARIEQQQAAMHDERDRIAADLHDHVIQRLFATGLTLHGAVAARPSSDRTDRIMTAITDIDETISQIRATVFALHNMGGRGRAGLRGRILGVATEVTPALGFSPALRFSGPIEGLVPDDVGEDLLAVLREALTNTARHAEATSVDAVLTATPTLVTLQVTDDGNGVDDPVRFSGLENLRRRAARHGGTFTCVPADPRGTRLTWSAPLGP